MTARLGQSVSRFILYILLFNIFSTAAFSATSGNMGGLTADNLQSSVQTFIICTPQGLKRISLDENGNPVGNEDGNLKPCVYCLSYHTMVVGIFFAPHYIVPFEDRSSKSLNILYSSTVPARQQEDCRTPRAPPQI
ncbi:MAG: hypothetical protein K9G26_00470 [Emcibacter sp.]|nr:hypothetical protein [Emcibacter sp.]